MPTTKPLLRLAPGSIFLLLGAGLSALAFYCRPGFISWDDLSIAQGSQFPDYQPGWLGFSYSYLVIFLLRLSGGFGSLLFLNTVICLVFLVLIFISIRRLKDIPLQIAVSCVLAVMFFLPNHLALFLTVRRDTTFSYLSAVLLMGIALKRDWRLRDLILASMAIAFVSDIRQEARLLLLAIPLFGWALSIWDRKQAAILFVCSFFLSALVFLGALQAQDKAFGYPHQLMSISSPLAEIYHRVNVETEHPQLHEAIADNMNVTELRSFYSPYTANVFHQGRMRQMNPKQFSEFRSAAYKLFWLHRDIWFENRIHTFLTTINLEQPVYCMPSSLYLYRWFHKIFPLFRESNQSTWIRKRIETSLRKPAIGIRFFSASFAFAFLVLVGAGMSYKKAPRAAFVAWLTLARAAVVFILAPDPIPAYYFPVLLVAMGVVPILIFELKGSRTFSVQGHGVPQKAFVKPTRWATACID